MPVTRGRLQDALLVGIRADQPLATEVAIGTLYSVSDESNLIEQSDGVNWVTYGGAGGGGGAPTTSSYVVIGLDAGLSADRQLTAGAGISLVDGGANSTITIAATGGSGTVTTTGSPVNNDLTKFSGATSITTQSATGTGDVVRATSPTLVTPALGTPSALVLTNATGLPAASLTGLGAGMGTFLATPSSANLAAAVTGETGTGALVFATSPTLVTPLLGTPTSGVLTNATGLPLTTGVTGDLPLANLAQASAASRLLGRGSAGGAGDYEEVTLGSGLTMTGTVLSSAGGADNEIMEWMGL